MSTPKKVVVAIAHAAFEPSRSRTLGRLLEQLAGDEITVLRSEKPEHARIWARRLWQWVAEQDVDAVICLNDDVEVCPNITREVAAMLDVVPPGTPIALHTSAPIAQSLAVAGDHWCRCHWLTGPAYVLTPETARELLTFWDALPASFTENEDNVAIYWSRRVGRPIWSSIPALAIHDTAEKSTLGYDNHPLRVTCVPFTRVPIPESWAPEGEPILVKNPWMTDEHMDAFNRSVDSSIAMTSALKRFADGGERPIPGSFSLAISHTPWVPERVASFKRLALQLGIPALHGRTLAARIFSDKEPNDAWSEKMWLWSAETTAEWCLFLQDDASLAPGFWPMLRAFLSALPKDAEVAGLQFAHASAPHLADEGTRIVTTIDGLIGVGYVVRRDALREFLGWRHTKLRDGWRQPGPRHLNEDTMLGLWCAVTGRRIYHPLPTPIDHDTSLASTYGNDQHINRKALLTWRDTKPGHEWTAKDLQDPAWWRGGTEIRHLGRFYWSTPMTARMHVLGLDVGTFARIKADDGSPVLTGLKYRMLAKVYTEPRYRIFLGTPHTKGGIEPEYADSVYQLQKLIGIDVRHEFSLDIRQEQQDLVRVRSRMLRIAYESDATHLVFGDGDNAWSAETLIAMLKTGKDFVQVPYLRRDGRGYTIRPIEEVRRLGNYKPEHIQPDNTVEIDGTGFGLTVISRECMRRMLEHYGSVPQCTDVATATREEILLELQAWRAGHLGLRFVDRGSGDDDAHMTTALFQLLNRDGMTLASEDMSFAQRWRDIGGKVWMYIGPGSPIAHYGRAKYQGQIDDLGFTHDPKEIAEVEALRLTGAT